MRKLSITLLLIALSFMTMEANSLGSPRDKYIQLGIWDNLKKEIVFMPIEAVLEGNNIELRFFEPSSEPVTIQVKDKNGNIVFQDTTIPDEQEIYKVDLNGFKSSQYELLYIEKEVTFVGEFEVE